MLNERVAKAIEIAEPGAWVDAKDIGGADATTSVVHDLA